MLPILKISLLFVVICCTNESATIADNTNYHAQTQLTDTTVDSPSSIIDSIIPCKLTIESTFSSYNTFKAQCLRTRNALNNKYNRLPDTLKSQFLDSIGQVYSKLIINGGLKFWEGTPWTFEGHTNTPQVGTVACGYLVSTLLKHSGINLNRYKMAQLAASDGAISLMGTTNTPKLLNKNAVWNAIDTLENGLYKVGLSFHVGFLWKTKNDCYFAHSNYINNEGVIIEDVICSEAFNASTVYQIVPISHNAFLMKKWLSGAVVTILKD